MAKHLHDKGLFNKKIADSIGNPDELINMLIEDAGERAQAVYEVTGEGPLHKQLLHTPVAKAFVRLSARNGKEFRYAFRKARRL
jgi:hypothetical protein